MTFKPEITQCRCRQYAVNLLIFCLLLFFQPDKVVEGDETSASAALFVKLDSAKNLPVSNGDNELKKQELFKFRFDFGRK